LIQIIIVLLNIKHVKRLGNSCFTGRGRSMEQGVQAGGRRRQGSRAPYRERYVS
jgi:hypothetical protein